MATIPNDRILSGVRELHGGRDAWDPYGIKVVNALVRAVGSLVILPGAAKLSYDLGLDILAATGGSSETVVWQRPLPYSVFGTKVSVFMNVVGARSELGTATFSLRLGGTDRGVDGTVIATATQAANIDPGYSPLTMTAQVSGTGAGQDYLKLTITPGAGDAKIKEGGVTLS